MSANARQKPQTETDNARVADKREVDAVEEKSDTQLEIEDLIGEGARVGHGFRRHGHGLYPPKRVEPRVRRYDDE